MNRKRLTIITVILCVAFLVSCATVNVNKPKQFWDMTSKEKLAYMYQIYNSQYDDYKSMAAMPNLTEAQKTMLRTKKDVLTKVEPLISTYDGMVQAGTPTKAQEQQIYDLLNQLQSNLSG